jgi:hypothetical protein
MFNRYPRSVHVSLEINAAQDVVKFNFVESKPQDHTIKLKEQKGLYALAQLSEVMCLTEGLLFDRADQQYYFSYLVITVETDNGHPRYQYKNDNHLTIEDVKVVFSHVSHYVDFYQPKLRCQIL